MAKTVRRTCKRCRRQFTPRRGTRRVTCYECRPERLVSGVESMSPRPPVEEPAGRIDGPMTAVVRAELERCGQEATVPGGVALRLARTLDEPSLKAGEVASISDKLLKVMEPLSRLGPREPDELDEFTRRLEEKRASA